MGRVRLGGGKGPLERGVSAERSQREVMREVKRSAVPGRQTMREVLAALSKKRRWPGKNWQKLAKAGKGRQRGSLADDANRSARHALVTTSLALPDTATPGGASGGATALPLRLGRRGAIKIFNVDEHQLFSCNGH